MTGGISSPTESARGLAGYSERNYLQLTIESIVSYVAICSKSAARSRLRVVVLARIAGRGNLPLRRGGEGRGEAGESPVQRCGASHLVSGIWRRFEVRQALHG